MNKKKISEEDQRNFFLKYFNNENPNELFYREVPVFSRSIDLVKYNKNINQITAIEFKLHDWKRAIKQALSVSISFDFLEICIPKPKTKKTQDRIITKCGDYGIGVYFFNEEGKKFNKVLDSKKKYDIWETQKIEVIKYIGELK